MKFSSLKLRITALTCLLAGLLWLLAAAATWVEARHEADELFDAHLVQAASLLIAQTGRELEQDEEGDGFDDSHAPELHRYARRVAFQVWIDQRLRLHSLNAPATPLSPTREGLSESAVEGETWRVFSAWNPKHQALVQVGERLAARDEMARSIAAGLLRPLLLALPLLALLIWLAVRQGVRPLERLAGELEQRSPDHLAHLPVEALPSEVRPLVEKLNTLFDRVARSFEQERRFTADAAHELRTPLAGLKAQAQVALGAATEEPRRHALDQLIRGCDRMTHLVEQLLVLARVDAGPPGNWEALDLATCAREVIALLAGEALEKAVDIELQAEGETAVTGNSAWLAILIRNLVDNAVRYSPRGARVLVRVSADPGGVLLQVEDSGPGVPQQELEHLGQRFWRSQESRPTLANDKGSGLGLSIAGKIAALHGGRLEFCPKQPQPGLVAGLRLPPARTAPGN